LRVSRISSGPVRIKTKNHVQHHPTAGEDTPKIQVRYRRFYLLIAFPAATSLNCGTTPFGDIEKRWIIGKNSLRRQIACGVPLSKAINRPLAIKHLKFVEL